MTLLDRLHAWHSQGKITTHQYHTLSALERRDRVSVYFELHALLYIGVIAFVGGLTWTIQAHFKQLGDPVVVVGLIALFLLCLGYCFAKATPFSWDEAKSPHFGFDYVLYLGCLAFSGLLTYVEYRFSILHGKWDLYLLVTSLLFLVFAYRFDNRFVLSLALSTLAAWFGVKLAWKQIFDWEVMGPYAIAYSVVLVGMGGISFLRKWKAHFRDTYFHIASHFFLLASLQGLFSKSDWAVWVPTFLLGVVVVLAFGFTTRQFSFISYGILYGYVGTSYVLMRWTNFLSPWYWHYYLISGLALVVLLVRLSRRYGRTS